MKNWKTKCITHARTNTFFFYQLHNHSLVQGLTKSDDVLKKLFSAENIILAMKQLWNLIFIFIQMITVISSSIMMKNYKKVEHILPKRKSELMCDQYSKMVQETRWVLSLSSKSVPIPIVYSNCDGQSNDLFLELIAGGRSALQGEFPHMAALSWQMPNGQLKYFCAGSLISEKWVLTSAHCSHGTFGKKRIIVQLGIHYLNTPSFGVTVRVKHIIRHWNYNPPTTYADIALMELEKSVTFGKLIKPACLQTDQKRNENSMKLWAAGWGVPYYGAGPSNVLLKAELEVVSNFNCSKMYKNSTAIPNGIVPSMLCAGDVKGGWRKDTCNGDSGSPLQQKHPKNCLFEIIGITSIGKMCAIGQIPGVYTRVWSYIDWIEEIVWPDHEKLT